MKTSNKVFLLVLFCVLILSFDKVSSLTSSSIKANLTPTISIDNSNNVSSKLVSIKCQKEYRCEYSYDMINWSIYEGNILINKTTNIYARTTDNNGDVVRSSSFKIIID